MEEAYSRAGPRTVLLVAVSVSFCLPHPVAVNALSFVLVIVLRCCECT